MGSFDSYLSGADREKLLRERISRFALEGYQYEMNLKFALEIGDQQSALEAQNAIEDLKTAISIHEAELSNLPNQQTKN